MSSILQNFTFLLICAFHVVTCLNINNSECVFIARKRCNLVGSKVALCNDNKEKFVKLRTCAPKSARIKLCIRCLVDENEIISSIQSENAVLSSESGENFILFKFIILLSSILVIRNFYDCWTYFIDIISYNFIQRCLYHRA